MKKLLLLFGLLIATNGWGDFNPDSILCKGDLKNKYKSVCFKNGKIEKGSSSKGVYKELEGYHEDSLKKMVTKLVFDDYKKNSKTADWKEADDFYNLNRNLHQYNLLNKSEEEIIFFIHLINKHQDSIGVKEKRKYKSKLKNYIKSIDSAISRLDKGQSRKRSKIDSLLRKINKHVNAYGGDFKRKAILEEKKLIFWHIDNHKKREYSKALILVDIESDVEGLDIYLDSQLKGQTPKSLSLEPRKYLLELKNKAFYLEEVLNPKEQKYYYGNTGKSSWTSDRLSSLRSELAQKTRLLTEKFSYDNVKNTINTLSNSKDFTSSYTKANLDQHLVLDEKINELVIDTAVSFGVIRRQVGEYVTDSNSLSELSTKLKEVKEINTRIRKMGLPLAYFLKKSDLVIFLDLKDEGLEIYNDTKALTFNKKDLEKIDDQKYLISTKLISNDINQNILSQKDIIGSFPIGTKQKFNPKYDIAVQRRDKAYRDYMQDQYEWEQQKEICARQSSKGRAFWCAVLYAPKKGPYEAAQSVLERTPRIIDETIYQDYYFTESKVKATKKIVLEVSIVDLKNKRIHKKEIIKVKNKNFKIYSGLKQDDIKYYKYKGNSYKDLERFLESAYSMKLSKLEDQIEDFEFDKRSPKLRGDLLSFVSARDKNFQIRNKNNAESPSSNSMLTPDERFYSVVKVLDKLDGSLGTGFYVSRNEIITNAHVVGNKKIINLENYDGEEFTGRVIKIDPNLDLALIKVNKSGLIVKFLTSGTLRTGSTVEAIGHPHGYSYSINRGIISGDRKLNINPTGLGNKVRYLQIDVAINPGNSGGPLFLGDKVIGVNTWGKDKKKTEGLNFAIHYKEVIDFIK